MPTPAPILLAAVVHYSITNEQLRGWTSTILSLLIGIAGWYYLLYSRAAHRLSIIESQKPNTRRIVLRRVNGAAMIVLAVLLYVATNGIDVQERPGAFAAVFLAVLVLLLAIVVLAMIDVRMTLKLRRDDRGSK
jgi:H+/gluconate symporter-like permease